MIFSDEQIEAAIRAALEPSRFFFAPGFSGRVLQRRNEETTWEVFRGHLLDASRTRQQRVFDRWHIELLAASDGSSVAASTVSTTDLTDLTSFTNTTNAPTSPLVSIAWDASERRLYFTRNLLLRVWEAYESAPGVIDSRPTQRWTPELVGSILVDQADSSEVLRAAISRYLELALIGVSRLPITSVESPLPSFALGHLAYLGTTADSHGPCVSASSIVERICDQPEHPAAPRWLETALRSATNDEVRSWIDLVGPVEPRVPWNDLLRRLFHQVSLSPYTGWTDRLLSFVKALTDAGQLDVANACDLLGHMLRHLVRHLTAYDLVRFHSFGANYPDALWLDGLLRHFVAILDSHPDLGQPRDGDSPATMRSKRLRRRALRQAWLTRCACEGLRVPDVPTSRGENARVIPGWGTHVPDEQITEPTARTRRLFTDDPSDQLLTSVARMLLEESLRDLREPSERFELGAATFLDRPLGVFKPSGAVDRTPLVAYVGFSRAIARARLEQLRRAALIPADVDWEDWNAALTDQQVNGVRVQDLPDAPRPGVIMLEDARVASDDFLICHTARGSLQNLVAAPGLGGPAVREILRVAADTRTPRLLVRTASVSAARRGAPWITLFDEHQKRLAEFRLAEPARAGEYDEWLGDEFPVGGLVGERFGENM